MQMLRAQEEKEVEEGEVMVVVVPICDVAGGALAVCVVMSSVNDAVVVAIDAMSDVFCSAPEKTQTSA